jgi:hypothetical protein
MANGYRIPLTHAARTAESEELQGPLTQQALGHGSDHLPIEYLVHFYTERIELTGCIGNTEEITLLDYRRIGCVLLLGEGRQGKGDCQYYEGTSKHVFIISSWGTAFIFGPFRLLYLKSWIPLESVSTI